MIVRVRLGTACALRHRPDGGGDIVVAVLGAVSGRAEHITAAAGSQAGAVFDFFQSCCCCSCCCFLLLLSTVVYATLLWFMVMPMWYGHQRDSEADVEAGTAA